MRRRLMKTPAHDACRPRRGLTIVETLAVLVITALLTTSLFGLLTAVVSGWRAAKEALVVEEEGMAVLALLKRDIESCYVGGTEIATFEVIDQQSGGADADELVLCCLAPPLVGQDMTAALRHISFRLAPRGGTGGLGLYRQEDTAFGANQATGRGSLITDRVAALNLLCFDGRQWRTSWHALRQGRVPEAVRIDLSLYRGERPMGGADDLGRDAPTRRFTSVVVVPLARYANEQLQRRSRNIPAAGSADASNRAKSGLTWRGALSP